MPNWESSAMWFPFSVTFPAQIRPSIQVVRFYDRDEIVDFLRDLTRGYLAIFLIPWFYMMLGGWVA